MKKLILAVTLALISTQPSAEEKSYTDIIKVKYACESVGGTAKWGFEVKTQGGSLEGLLKEVEKAVSKKNKDEMSNIVKMGYGADSEEEAYMLGWGYCMDEYS